MSQSEGNQGSPSEPLLREGVRAQPLETQPITIGENELNREKKCENHLFMRIGEQSQFHKSHREASQNQGTLKGAFLAESLESGHN